MTIRHLSYQQIDFQQWDQAIERIEKGLPYAYSWYLDILTQKRWSGLIYGDYELVMPLPWNRKLLGYKQIYQPLLSQQLGVFGSPSLNCAQLQTFLSAIPSQYRYIQLPLHLDQREVEQCQKLGRLRLNLTLDLHQDYEKIKQNYSKSLRKRLRKTIGTLQLENSEDIDFLVNYYRQELTGKVSLRDKEYQLIKRLFRELLQRELGSIKAVKDERGEVVSSGFFINTRERIINVFGASNNRGRKLFAMHFLLDSLIQMNAKTGKFFDFEGSEIPGVAEFFKSFGAEPEYYLEYKSDQLPFWLSRLRNRHLPL